MLPTSENKMCTKIRTTKEDEVSKQAGQDIT